MSTTHHAGPALPERAVHELAAATAALVGEHDVIGTATNLLHGCAESVGAAAGGIVLTQPGVDRLEFLAATDHRAGHLEMYQVQTQEGPAMDCVSTGESVTVAALEDLGRRWPSLAEQFARAGFVGVHAAPMIWQGETIGALNLFFRELGSTAGTGLIAQAFADIAALSIMHTRPLPPAEIAARTRSALDTRAVIEYAKGVLAQTHGLTMDAAFDRLVELAHDQQQPLTILAAVVVDQAAGHTP